VAALVADGRANPDIAARLFRSRRTVQAHVSSILTKLDLTSRAELAAKRGVSVGAIDVAIHRLRQRFGALLRDQVRRTVSSDAEVEEDRVPERPRHMQGVKHEREQDSKNDRGRRNGRRRHVGHPGSSCAGPPDRQDTGARRLPPNGRKPAARDAKGVP
jgi:hypothetical protein